MMLFFTVQQIFDGFPLPYDREPVVFGKKAVTFGPEVMHLCKTLNKVVFSIMTAGKSQNIQAGSNRQRSSCREKGRLISAERNDSTVPPGVSTSVVTL